MRNRGIFGLVMATLVALSLVIADPAAYARGGGGGGGRSSSGFSGGGRSSFSGGSSRAYASSGGFSGGYKSSSPAPTYRPAPAPAVKSSGGFSGGYKSNPVPASVAKSSAGFSGGPKASAAAGTPNTPVAKAVAPQRDAAAAAKTQKISKQQSQKAMADYKAQQAKFKYAGSPVSASPASKATVSRVVNVNHYHYSPGGYAYRRTAFYDHYHWTPYPWSYALYPRFGAWDTFALLFWMDHLQEHQYRMAMYSHYNDPEMMAFRQQLQQQAATNAELRAKLAAMDQQMNNMRAQGVQADPNYVPPAMQEVALSEDALKATNQEAQRQPIATPAVYTQPAPVQPPPPQHKTSWGWILLGGAAFAGLIYYFGFARKY